MTLKKLQIAIVVGAAMAVPTLSFGAYATNFNPPTFSQGSLSGQDNWDTNNYSDNGTPLNFADDLGQSDFVGVIPNYSTSANDYWGALGGVTQTAPVVNTSFLYHPANLAGATSARFNVDFSISGPQTPAPRTNRDTFGWTLQSSLGGSQLLRVAFEPDLINQLNNLNIRVFNAANGELLGAGSFSNQFNIFYDAKYNLDLTLNGAGLLNLSVRPLAGGSPTTIMTNFATGVLPSSIADIAATWTLANTTANANGERPNYGANSIIFDNYVVVPEPTTMLAALGVVGVVMTRRRRQVA
jgi:hypothetical protein